jgi:hypothetical protein
MDGMPIMDPFPIWTVTRDGRGWSVVREEEKDIPIRERLSGLPCITAQVLAAELNAAWREGMGYGARVYRESLALEALGD